MRASTVVISAVFFAIHFAIAASTPIFNDEAYYALWARQIASGYYDHPPMIAYMIRLGTSFLGETTLGIRLFPILCFSISGYLVGEIARCVSNAAVGLPELATALYNLNVLVFALGSFATPDAPSTLFWVAALWVSFHAVNRAPNTRFVMLWWVGVGFIVGLGILSKFTNAFLAFGLLAYLVATSKGRTYLRTHLPYVAMAVALLPLLPYLSWNYQNGWLGFERQSQRLAASGFSARYIGGYIALLLLAPTPLVTWFAFRGLKSWLKDSALLAWSSAPLLLYFTYHATHAPIPGNWIVPVQAPFAILAASGLFHAWSSWRWTKVTLALATGISVGLVAMAFNPFTPIGRSDNPPNQTRGWSTILGEVEALREETGATWIATTDYARTGSLAIRLPHMPVWSLTQLQRYGFRGTFPKELCKTRGLLIEAAKRSESRSKTAPRLFETVGTTRGIIRTQADVTLMRFHITPVSGVKSRYLCGD